MYRHNEVNFFANFKFIAKVYEIIEFKEKLINCLNKL